MSCSLNRAYSECFVLTLLPYTCTIPPYPRISYHTTKGNPVRTFDEISAVIRLAHKYNIQQVQEQALASLQDLGFVTSFSAYSNPPEDSPLALDPWFNIAVVNIARLTKAPSLLPLALFRCAYLGGDLVDGWAHKDGTVEHLAQSDLRRCVDWHAALMHEYTVFLFALLDDAVSADCARPTACAAKLRSMQRNAVCSEGLALRHDPLQDWATVVKSIKDAGTVCGSCAREMAVRARNGQKAIFDRLPEIFGIEVEGE